MLDIDIRLSSLEEKDTLIKWLSDPIVLQWFPMYDEREIEDAVRTWLSYTRFKSCFTAWREGVPVGMTILYLQPYHKYAHHSLFAIIVDEKFRGKGIGHQMIHHLIDIATNQFHLKILHLEVYAGNPAIRLYERAGFKQYGIHKNFIKTPNGYIDKILMQKYLHSKDF